MNHKLLLQISHPRKMLLVFFLLVLGPTVFAQDTNASSPLVLANATLIDGTGSAPKAGVTVVIRNGRIFSIMDDADAAPPAGSSVVDLSDRFILPGLVDAHVHMSNNPNSRKAAGGSPVRMTYTPYMMRASAII